MTTFLIILASVLGFLLLIAITVIVIIFKMMDNALSGLSQGLGIPNFKDKKKST